MCMKQNKPTFADSATGILQLPSEEPFVVGMNVSVPSPEFQLQKLEHFTLVVVNQGTAQVEIDFRLFRIKQGDMLVLATAQFFQCIEADLHARHLPRSDVGVRHAFLCFPERISLPVCLRRGECTTPESHAARTGRYLPRTRPHFPSADVQKSRAKLSDEPIRQSEGAVP